MSSGLTPTTLASLYGRCSSALAPPTAHSRASTPTTSAQRTQQNICCSPIFAREPTFRRVYGLAEWVRGYPAMLPSTS
ncbi:hypothetical protein EXIGLDRAFT_729735 [Exidia glandulosa HHB12029]|uniref:Uncharacterized protein n=1 Tax=Exidia glandulosa HHB12029 TaxID=1314781 RepID=A0A165CGY5_EXIGL|nr:hypothetical protein EXIGLDRAFT_729735 [Exidia glandulosa HHB12029]